MSEKIEVVDATQPVQDLADVRKAIISQIVPVMVASRAMATAVIMAFEHGEETVVITHPGLPAESQSNILKGFVSVLPTVAQKLVDNFDTDAVKIRVAHYGEPK